MPPNRFESEVESFLEGSHGDRTHIKRADHHTVTPLCGTLLRGENDATSCAIAGSLGLSPLTRGKPGSLSSFGRRNGLIPASLSLPRAHPRSRGENQSLRWRCFRGQGLSPAHAGKTQQAAIEEQKAKAHPRSRGENYEDAFEARYLAGSSPLTRGKRMDRRSDTRRQGLIPAHAGKTAPVVAACAPSRAHPRSRGENLQIGWLPFSARGSSPLTRGKPQLDAAGFALTGLIPAHAGKTGCKPDRER